MILEVIDGGLLTTVQDAGRRDWTHLGVPVSGAADAWSRAVANLLVGNEPDAAVLEMTIVGPTLVARDGGLIGLAGTDLGGHVVGRGSGGAPGEPGRRLAPGRSHRILPGETIEFPGSDDGIGARTYLAVPGGIDVPLVLGSRSTCLAGAFGGLDGRALRAGDTIAAAAATAATAAGADQRPELAWPESECDGAVGADGDTDDGSAAGAGMTGGRSAAVLRVVPGPWPGIDALVDASWRVGAAADRVGVRLDGSVLPAGVGDETLTQGMSAGAIQAPPDGRPIILSADHQTTGGYRVIAIVISADLPVLGQLRPGDDVRLEQVDLAAADGAARRRRDRLAGGAQAMHEAAAWDRLASSAGG